LPHDHPPDPLPTGTILLPRILVLGFNGTKLSEAASSVYMLKSDNIVYSAFVATSRSFAVLKKNGASTLSLDDLSRKSSLQELKNDKAVRIPTFIYRIEIFILNILL